MGRRRMPTGTPLPKALACGMLEDGGRVLFLVRSERSGGGHVIQRLEMPCVLVPSGRSPYAEIKEAFPRMTGIDAEIGDIVIEGRHNAGSRKRRNWVPVLVFRVSAKNRFAKPSPEFSGFKWLSLEDAKGQKLGRNAEWLRKSLRREEKVGGDSQPG